MKFFCGDIVRNKEGAPDCYRLILNGDAGNSQIKVHFLNLINIHTKADGIFPEEYYELITDIFRENNGT